ncbi:hypothetical protein [Microbacterium sp. W4I20]|uniref:hypothetical protein n=1 Tax=Microbacterium sp. W4I20 TaxID=3042262 RepID=UPI0027876964|nr:hypothetical protein [Microbacterium sp. W4I20]MDQ0728355.1 uncharacterized membrane protein YciS (DUF1049 family) [Microbacterium sp. W4I20]
MDNGAFFFVFFVGPLLPAIIAIAVGIMFALGVAVHALIGATVSSVVELSRSRRERSYVRKHQRDLSRL